MRSAILGAALVGALGESAGRGTLAVTWEDCGDSNTHGHVQSVLPSSIQLGVQTTLTAKSSLDEGIAGGTFEAKLNAGAGLVRQTYNGDICGASTFSLPLGLGTITWDGLACPIAAGILEYPMDVKMSGRVPASLASSEVSITATASNGDKLLCAKINLNKAVSSADEWEEWKMKFGKTYNGGGEEEARFAIFSDNLAFIKSENAKGLSYSLATNMFSDLTVEEFSQIYMGYVEPTKSFGSMPYLGEHVMTAAPTSVDWTRHGAVTAVKNQASCGSCWSFSTTGALEGAYKISGASLIPLSEQQFVDCAKSAGNGCSGGSMYNAFEWAMDNGICTEDTYPYEAVDGNCRSSGCSVGLPQGAVVGVKSVNHWIFSASEDALMSAIAQQPVSIAIEADKRAFQSYSGGVLAANAGCGTSLDHGVLAVGYGVDQQYGAYWKVKNSWSSGWGENGYIRLARGNGGAGTCGLLKQPVYPVISSSAVV